MTPPPSDPTASAASSGALPAVGDAVPAVADVGVSRIHAALVRFVASRKPREGRDFVRRVVVRKLYGRKPRTIDPVLVDDLTHFAVIRILDAEALPWTEMGVPGWVTRVTRRAIAEYFRARKQDEENLDRSVDVATLGFDRHAPSPDWGAREHLIARHMESLIGRDPMKVHTFRLMMKKEVEGYSLADLAREHHTTEKLLSSRFYKLRKELAPKIAIMDEEKPRRFILFALFFLGLGALVALGVALWLVLHPPPPPPLPPRPAPSATAMPAPTFDQALPPPRAPASADSK